MGKSPLHTFISYLSHILSAKGAHRLHSPFVYEIRQLIRNATRFKIDEVEDLRQELKRNYELIDTVDFKSNSPTRRTISSVASTSSSSMKFAAFLHLLANYVQAHTILETGTSLGLTTAYLSKSSAEQVITIEGSPILARLAEKNWKALELAKPVLVNEDLHHSFIPLMIKHTPDFIFLDADHRGTTIVEQINQIVEHTGKRVKCIVIHDIYWSRDMTECWRAMVQDVRFNLTIDVFQAGIIFPNIEINKQHFKLRF